ncbi:hypothetical protein COU57_01205 [Candidatus Pacearchaeota archaeon CG10_big_fil_rev_8_21_14_0_10_32_14]|nr:MAG: hypothetical protein COU57_01205 [Candidatus Pacearchaeota archaeon CG10_big_fil_rev_8_21_14_0_10_32_14]
MSNDLFNLESELFSDRDCIRLVPLKAEVKDFEAYGSDEKEAKENLADVIMKFVEGSIYKSSKSDPLEIELEEGQYIAKRKMLFTSRAFRELGERRYNDISADQFYEAMKRVGLVRS